MLLLQLTVQKWLCLTLVPLAMSLCPCLCLQQSCRGDTVHSTAQATCLPATGEEKRKFFLSVLERKFLTNLSSDIPIFHAAVDRLLASIVQYCSL